MSWLDEAACKPYPLDVFFPAPGEHHLAVKVCQGCPVRAECLEDARATEDPYDPHGIRGGLTARQRQATREGRYPCPECGRMFAPTGMGQHRRRSHGVDTAPCGSDPGYQRHRRDGVEPCQPCKDAHAAKRRQRNRRTAA